MQAFPYFDGTFIRRAPDNADGSHNIAGYIFRFGDKGAFHPAGRLDGITPEHEKAHNDNLDRASIEAAAKHGRGLFYLTGPDTVTSWGGTFKDRATVHKGFHNIARIQRSVYFTGPDGKRWFGRQYGDNGQSFTAKRLK